MHLHSYVQTPADSEGSGARSKLDAVLQGLVERSENERSVILLLEVKCSDQLPIKLTTPFS